MPSESGASSDGTQLSADREPVPESEADAGAISDSQPDTDAETDADTGTDTDTEPDRGVVEWGPVRFDRLRSLAFGASATVAGLVLVALSVVAVTVGASLLDGGGPPASTWALLVVLLVGGPVSLLYWIVAYDQMSPERRRKLRSQFGDYSFDRSRFRIGWTLAGAGVVLAVVAAAIGSGPVSATLSLFSGFAPLLLAFATLFPVLAGSRGTDLRLDPAAETIERTYLSHDRTRSDDLGSVIRTRRIDLPWTTVFLLAYRGNAWYRSTPWLFVPADRADEVERALDATLARSDGPDRASVPERIILAVVGSASLVVGLAMALAAGEPAAGALLALLTAPFSLLFLALAARL
ncbi:hypothetical protein CK500_13285 [Halorubrum salipaludis]|uniref:Uncharacterized protein n=1 Tax=Halorubrum salipaludis TaxID=2032630 RepID=A0A2A2FC72_9EURY|nr:hypothetical protein [Halorubrum salipaludis]PAU82568.1 hypothetical protein CK500_13285 [Halorubrum salipaludis]